MINQLVVFVDRKIFGLENINFCGQSNINKPKDNLSRVENSEGQEKMFDLSSYNASGNVPVS